MAIGDTVNAGLMRVDFSPIQRAGEAQARANQAFGNAIGGVINKFYQKKKDKQEREEREQAYRQMGLSDEEAKAASRDKDLANQFINKMNADRNYDLQVDQFNEASALRDLQRQIAKQNLDNQQADRLRVEQERMQSQTNTENRNRFLKTGGSELLQTDQGQNLYDRMVQSGVNPQTAFEDVKAFEQRIAQSQPKPMTLEDLANLRGKLLANQKALKESGLPVLTEGEQVIDKLTAEEYNEYVNLGGKSAVQSKIKKLNKAIQDLEGSDDLNSWLTGVLPESMKALFNEKGLSVQQAVESVIQENLRETLGAQFAQKEGEMFMARGYDARLSDEVNIERVKSLLKEIEDRASARTQTFDYFKKNKTMKGYDGPVFNESTQPSPSSSFDPQEIDRLYEEKMRLGKARGLR